MVRKSTLYLHLYSRWITGFAGVCAFSTFAFAEIGGFPTPLISGLTNAPNPVDTRVSGPLGQTQISYQLASDLPVDVTLYDLFGLKIRAWHFPAAQTGGRQGANAFTWDGTNESGQKVSKGGYIAQVEIDSPTGTATAYRKIAVIH